MSLGAIQGKDAIFSVYNGTTFAPYLCASDISVEVNTEFTQTRTKGQGAWKRSAPQSLGYKITLDGIWKVKPAEINGAYFLDLQRQFLPYLWKIIFMDEDGETSTLSGEALVESSVISIGTGKVVEGNFSFVGNGELKQYIGLEPCETAVTGAYTVPNGFLHSVHVHATVEGIMDHLVYSLDGGTDNVSSAEVFTVSTGTAGIHSILITPVCINGQRGTPFTLSFDSL